MKNKLAFFLLVTLPIFADNEMSMEKIYQNVAIQIVHLTNREYSYEIHAKGHENLQAMLIPIVKNSSEQIGEISWEPAIMTAKAISRDTMILNFQLTIKITDLTVRENTITQTFQIPKMVENPVLSQFLEVETKIQRNVWHWFWKTSFMFTIIVLFYRIRF